MKQILKALNEIDATLEYGDFPRTRKQQRALNFLLGCGFIERTLALEDEGEFYRITTEGKFFYENLPG